MAEAGVYSFVPAGGKEVDGFWVRVIIAGKMPTPENFQRIEVQSSPRSLLRWWTEATKPIDTAAAGQVQIEIPRDVLGALAGRTIPLLRRDARELGRGETIPTTWMISFGDIMVEDEGLRGRVAIYPFLGKLAPQVELAAANDPKKPGELSFQVKGRGLAWPVVEVGKKTAAALELQEMMFFKEGVIKMLVGDALGVDISSWKLDKGRLVIEGRKVPTSELYRRYHAPFLATIRKIRGENVTEAELRPRVTDGIVLNYLDLRDYQGDDYPGQGAREEKAALIHYNLIERVLARRMRRRLEQALGVTSAELQGDRRFSEKLAKFIGIDSWRIWFNQTSRSLSNDEAWMVIRIDSGEEDYDNFYQPEGEFYEYSGLVEATEFEPKMDKDEFVKRLYYGKPDEFIFDSAGAPVGVERLSAAEKYFWMALELLDETERSVISLDREELHGQFDSMRSIFSELPAGSKVMAEVMKNVNDQLGAEGEKMRKSGKKDEEIFEEWLKQVFIPLYRRAAKK